MILHFHLVYQKIFQYFLLYRIFNHANVLPVLGGTTDAQKFIILSPYMPFGSLYNVIHGESGLVIDNNQAIKFELDIAKGMNYLHNLDPPIINFNLTSKHVMVSKFFLLNILYTNVRDCNTLIT